MPERALVTVLSGISNHDNAGAIFRNSAAFGASLVILDETSCDPLYRKAIRVSVGSVLTVPFHEAAIFMKFSRSWTSPASLSGASLHPGRRHCARFHPASGRRCFWAPKVKACRRL